VLDLGKLAEEGLNPMAIKKKTGGTKKGQRRKTSRRAFEKNPPKKRTSGTKKGQTRKTVSKRKAYEKGTMENPPAVFAHPAVQGALAGAAAIGIEQLVDMVMKTGGDGRAFTKIGANIALGAALASKMVAKGAYKDAGAAMIGIGTYQAVQYARAKMAAAAAPVAAGASTGGIAATPFGPPAQTMGLTYDPFASTLQPRTTVSTYM
jgi:hypothetical protein